MNTILRACAAAGSLCAAQGVLAHHSAAMFDAQAEKVLSGTVSEFQWTNPHTWVEMDVLDDTGSVTHWSLESGSVVGLARQGWKRNTIKVGDKISVVFHPLRSGEHGGSLMGVVTADGKTLGDSLTPRDKK